MVPPGYIPPGYTPGAMWGKRNAQGNIVWACHCDCHLPTYEGDGTEPRPEAVRAMLCEPCFNEAFTPWNDTLEAML